MHPLYTDFEIMNGIQREIRPMKVLQAFVALLLCSSHLSARPPIFKVDPSASTVRFHVQAALENVTGTFEAIELESIEFNGRPTSLKGRLAIVIDSLQTGKTKRDIHLKEAEFFDSANHPRAYVDVISITEDEGEYYVHFALEIRGIRREYHEPIQLSANWMGVEAKGTLVVNRRDFGVNGNILTNTIINDEVTLEYNIVLVR